MSGPLNVLIVSALQLVSLVSSVVTFCDDRTMVDGKSKMVCDSSAITCRDVDGKMFSFSVYVSPAKDVSKKVRADLADDLGKEVCGKRPVEDIGGFQRIESEEETLRSKQILAAFSDRASKRLGSPQIVAFLKVQVSSMYENQLRKRPDLYFRQYQARMDNGFLTALAEQRNNISKLEAKGDKTDKGLQAAEDRLKVLSQTSEQEKQIVKDFLSNKNNLCNAVFKSGPVASGYSSQLWKCSKRYPFSQYSDGCLGPLAEWGCTTEAKTTYLGESQPSQGCNEPLKVFGARSAIWLMQQSAMSEGHCHWNTTGVPLPMSEFTRRQQYNTLSAQNWCTEAIEANVCFLQTKWSGLSASKRPEVDCFCETLAKHQSTCCSNKAKFSALTDPFFAIACSGKLECPKAVTEKVTEKVSVLSVELRIAALDYDKVMADSSIKQKVTDGIITAFLNTLGTGYDKSHLKVTFSKGSLKAKVEITPKVGSDSGALKASLTASKSQIEQDSKTKLVAALSGAELTQILEDGKKKEDLIISSKSPVSKEGSSTTSGSIRIRQVLALVIFHAAVIARASDLMH